MDTNQAVTMVEGLISQATAIRDSQQALIDGYNVILGLLQGTLKTELNSLTPDQVASLTTSQATLSSEQAVLPAE